MVVGSPPFYSKNRQLTFRLILSAEINFPDGMDAQCVHLIRALLTREPKKRLGRHAALRLCLHPALTLSAVEATVLRTSERIPFLKALTGPP
jgi:hypothetical protein